MDDLSICKRIAEIEGVDFDYNDERVMYWREEGSPVETYNPLTDDALIFTLAFDNKVKIDYFDECVYITAPRTVARHRFDKDDIASLRKAICLAIIEAHKEQS